MVPRLEMEFTLRTNQLREVKKYSYQTVWMGKSNHFCLSAFFVNSDMSDIQITASLCSVFNWNYQNNITYIFATQKLDHKIAKKKKKRSCSRGCLRVLFWREKKVQQFAACFSIHFLIMAERNHEESPHITPVLQHNERAAQPASTAFLNNLTCIDVSQITQHAHHSPAAMRTLPCGHSSPLIIFIIISQLRGVLPAFISCAFPPSFFPSVIHHFPVKYLTVSPRFHLTFPFNAFRSEEFLKPNYTCCTGTERICWSGNSGKGLSEKLFVLNNISR